MFRQALGDLVRLLTFRLSREGFAGLGRTHLWLGLLCTWIVGMGRWWDDPRAGFVQHLGLGSVVYVFLLALALWLLVMPLGPRSWSYLHVLTFVTLTSPPAAAYAIPVERWMDLSSAREWNVWFLAVTAAWRVALLMFYLRRHAGLGFAGVGVATLLPIVGVIVALTVLNLERAVFDLMSGLRDDGTPADLAYRILVMLTILSVYLFLPLLIAYGALVIAARRQQRSAAPESGGDIRDRTDRW